MAHLSADRTPPGISAEAVKYHVANALQKHGFKDNEGRALALMAQVAAAAPQEAPSH